MNGKSVFASKTMWVNAIAFLASIATVFGVDIAPDMQAELVMGIMAAVNIFLRFVTKEPVEMKM